jgi:hypothetical protein
VRNFCGFRILSVVEFYMGGPVVPPVASPCLLTRLAGSFFSASAGTVTLKLTDNAGDTVFDCAHCVLNDITNTPSTSLPVTCVAPAKQTSFTLATGHKYTLQLVFIQVPTPGSSADLMESPCGQVLDTIDQSNQAQMWNIQL